MKTKITFEKESDTEIKVLHDGKHVGNIWSENGNGATPFPDDGHISTLESIQICGFREASKTWACGIIHGTKDIVLRFNPLSGEFYEGYKQRYADYIKECLKNNKPEMIKTFDDFVSHGGHPDSNEVARSSKK